MRAYKWTIFGVSMLVLNSGWSVYAGIVWHRVTWVNLVCFVLFVPITRKLWREERAAALRRRGSRRLAQTLIRLSRELSPETLDEEP